jgi:hypothetical protein
MLVSGGLELQARRGDRDRRDRQPAGRPAGTGPCPPRQVATKAQPRSWEKPLRALLDAPAAQAARSPLEIERPCTRTAADLSGCHSPQLWSLFDEAARLGMTLVHACRPNEM